MPAWVTALLSAVAGIVLTVVKSLFGTDKVQKVTTDEKPSPLPPAERDRVLKNLGLPPAEPAPPADADRMHDRPNG